MSVPLDPCRLWPAACGVVILALLLDTVSARRSGAPPTASPPVMLLIAMAPVPHGRAGKRQEPSLEGVWGVLRALLHCPAWEGSGGLVEV